MEKLDQDHSMVTFDRGNSKFTFRSAGILLHKDKVLLNRVADQKLWFLPGGRVELYESTRVAIRREYKEELDADIEINRLLWCVEYFYYRDNINIHELNFIFLVNLKSSQKLFDVKETFNGVEDNPNLLFKWFHLSELGQLDVKPMFLKESLLSLPNYVEHIEVFKKPSVLH